MKVLNLACCSDFYTLTKAAERPIRNWVTVVRNAEWDKFADVRRTFRTVDVVGKFLVFNVGGNKYRLVAVVNYEFGWVKVVRALTHDEYDRLDIRRL